MIQAAERQAVEPSQAASLHLNIHTAEGPEVISLVFDTLEAKADWEDQLLKAKELLERQEEKEENNKLNPPRVRNINFIFNPSTLQNTGTYCPLFFIK
jgi:hypothetical protein